MKENTTYHIFLFFYSLYETFIEGLSLPEKGVSGHLLVAFGVGLHQLLLQLGGGRRRRRLLLKEEQRSQGHQGGDDRNEHEVLL